MADDPRGLCKVLFFHSSTAEMVREKRLEGIAFRAAETDLGHFLMNNRGNQIHVAGTLSADHWQGNRRVQFRILDAAKAP